MRYAKRSFGLLVHKWHHKCLQNMCMCLEPIESVLLLGSKSNKIKIDRPLLAGFVSAKNEQIPPQKRTLCTVTIVAGHTVDTVRTPYEIYFPILPSEIF